MSRYIHLFWWSILSIGTEKEESTLLSLHTENRTPEQEGDFWLQTCSGKPLGRHGTSCQHIVSKTNPTTKETRSVWPRSPLRRRGKFSRHRNSFSRQENVKYLKSKHFILIIHGMVRMFNKTSSFTYYIGFTKHLILRVSQPQWLQQ